MALPVSIPRCHPPPPSSSPGSTRRAAPRPPVVVTRAGLPSRAVAAFLAVTLALPARAELPVALNSAELFSKSCGGCHTGGGNVVDGAQTLRAPDLARNGLTDEEALYQIVYSGKRKMPGYGTDCAPRGQCTFGERLSDEAIRGLAAFVSAQAAAGWP